MPNIYGSPNNKTFELIQGSEQDDLIFPLGGWDYVDGRSGTDTIVVLGLSSQFRLVQDNSITYIDALSSASAYADRVQLVNVEKVQFSDKIVALDTPRLYTAQSGDDEYLGSAGSDWLCYERVRSDYALQTIGSAWRVSDKQGLTGTDILRSIERVRFADGIWLIPENAWLTQTPHEDYQDLPDQLYQFFALAFAAAPGVTYMDQLAQAYRSGLTVQTIVNIFTTKTQFTDVYPTALDHGQMASTLVDHIVKDSADANARQEAVRDITAALDLGWSVGDVVYQVFGNLAHIDPSDPEWGGTAHRPDGGPCPSCNRLTQRDAPCAGSGKCNPHRWPGCPTSNATC